MLTNALGSQKNNRNRVFFHELGHFVAGELNKKLLGGYGTKSIKIFQSPKEYGEYEGACEPEKPENYVETDAHAPVDRERLPQYLAGISYGCIFEAYYLNGDLDKCSRLHGADDFGGWSKALRDNGYDSKREELTTDMDEYLLKLKEEQALKTFFDINPDDFLKDDGAGGYLVNIDDLRSHIDSLLETHQETYKSHIDNYKAKLSPPREG